MEKSNANFLSREPKIRNQVQAAIQAVLGKAGTVQFCLSEEKQWSIRWERAATETHYIDGEDCDTRPVTEYDSAGDCLKAACSWSD